MKENNILKKSKLYFDSYEEVTDNITGTTQNCYLYATDGLFAIISTTENSTSKVSYVHKDNLGSIIGLTDEDGTIIPGSLQSYDAFGNQRNPMTWLPESSISAPMFDRGYTGHEHLTEFGIINMNGRCYDPKLGRFLSPDLFIQDPMNSQNYNRYTYCLNNPLNLLDATGYEYGWPPDDYPYDLVETDLPPDIAFSSYVAPTEIVADRIYDFSDFIFDSWDIEFGHQDRSIDVDFDTYSSSEIIIGPSNLTIAPLGAGQITNGQGGGYLGSANNWLNGAGYASGGLGVVQIGMLDYRQSLPLMSKIGTFSRFSSSYRVLGTTSKALGGAANWVGAPLTTYLDYNSMQNGEISGARFAYRTSGTVSSIGGGAAIGAAFGGPWGAAGGALIGAGFVAGEFVYDGVRNAWNLTINQISNFENAVKSGWYPGR